MPLSDRIAVLRYFQIIGNREHRMRALLSAFLRTICTLIESILLALGLLALGAIALFTSHFDLVGHVFAGCGEPCVVRENRGGAVHLFTSAAVAVHLGGRKQVIIDGYCHSACAMFADRARPHVCITPNATFGFHKKSWVQNGILTHGDPTEHSKEIHQWVIARGGYPLVGIVQMDHREALRFWPFCSAADSGKPAD